MSLWWDACHFSWPGHRLGIYHLLGPLATMGCLLELKLNTLAAGFHGFPERTRTLPIPSFQVLNELELGCRVLGLSGATMTSNLGVFVVLVTASGLVVAAGFLANRPSWALLL